MRIPVLALRTLHNVYSRVFLNVERMVRLLADLPVVFGNQVIEQVATIDHYNSSAKYRDIENQTSGFFPFEIRMLEKYFPLPPARLLLPGAGGGREMIALLDRGYTVDAFEPAASLVEAANKIIIPRFGTRLRQATLQKWSKQPHGTYDAIFTGWGMWTHIIRHHDRITALRAFRKVCPLGPLLLSFWRYENVTDNYEASTTLLPLYPEPHNRMDRLTRSLLRQKILRLPPIERGTGWSAGMYVHYTSELELREEGSMAGWKVVFYEKNAFRYPHAVLIPTRS